VSHDDALAAVDGRHHVEELVEAIIGLGGQGL